MNAAICTGAPTVSSHRKRRRLTAGRAVTVCVAAIALGAAPGLAGAQSTALLLGGKGPYKVLTEKQMVEAFGGYFAGYDKRVNVPFPGTDDLDGSVKVGADNLYAAVYNTPGFKTIGGVSEGAPAVIEVLRRLQADAAHPEAGKIPPPKEDMNVAIYGAPSKRFLGDLADLPVPVTPYDIIIVRAEYDAIADFPDDVWNGLAVLNALMGGFQLHVQQSNFDIRNIPTYYTITTNSAQGTTTDILIPTKVLPLLGPLVALHFNQKFIANLDGMLRPIIDSAYDRPAMDYGIPPTIKDKPVPPVQDMAAAAVPQTVKATLAADIPAPKFATRITDLVHTLQDHATPAVEDTSSGSEQAGGDDASESPTDPSDTSESTDGGSTDTGAAGSGASASDPAAETGAGDSAIGTKSGSSATKKSTGSGAKKAGGWKLKVGAGKHAAASSSAASSGGDE